MADKQPRRRGIIRRPLDAVALLQALEIVVERAERGSRFTASAQQLAEKHLKATNGDAEAAISRLLAREVGKTATVGFATGIGGFITLPVALPADLVASGLYQARIVLAIAYLRGWPIEDERVHRVAQGCLVGDAAAGAAKRELLRRAAPEAISRVILKAMARVAPTIAGKAAGRTVPVVGGLLCAGVDAATARSTAAVARRYFHPRDPLFALPAPVDAV
jgi:EcsC protein family